MGGVEGIVNGMDTTDWSPNVDKFLDVKYDADTVDEGKALAKETLQAELGLPVSCWAGSEAPPPPPHTHAHSLTHTHSLLLVQGQPMRYSLVSQLGNQ